MNINNEIKKTEKEMEEKNKPPRQMLECCEDPSLIKAVELIKLKERLKTLKQCEKMIEENTIKHFFTFKDGKIIHICNKEVNTDQDRVTNDYFKVTCLEYKKLLTKDRIKIELSQKDTEWKKKINNEIKELIDHYIPYRQITDSKKAQEIRKVLTELKQNLLSNHSHQKQVKQLQDGSAPIELKSSLDNADKNIKGENEE